MDILRVMVLFPLVHFTQQQVTNTGLLSPPELKYQEKKCADEPTTDHRCGCDPECAMYGDCCPDSIYFKAEEQKLGASTATCYTKSDIHFFVMTRCPSAWQDPQTRYLCENPDPNYPNPMLDTLVTSLSTNVTYRNSYCASCHNELQQHLSLWPLEVFCEFDQFRVKRLVSLEYLQHMVYDETRSNWYFDLGGLEIDRQCVSCTISIFEEYERYSYAVNCPSPPAVYFPNGTKVYCDILGSFNSRMEEEGRLRRCKFSISKCASDWNDTIESEKCEAYMSQVYACPRTYRNYHCALCNYVVRARMAPILSGDRLVWNHAFSELLHWGYGATCAKSEVFDTLSRQCIKVLPHQKGTRMEDGSCTNRSFFQEQYILSEDNSSVFVLTLQATYYQHEFFIQNSLLVLCLPKHLVRQFAPELRYITAVGLSLSITCLVLHLLVLCLVPALVNLPAMNLASLCVALLLLYSSFIANGTVNPGTTSCVVVGVIMHYGMLASFFWMLIISFDIFNMTRRTEKKLVALKVLWHFFVVFNTMQGVFIFLTFTCNRKVLKELKNLFNRITSYKTKTTSTTVN